MSRRLAPKLGFAGFLAFGAVIGCSGGGTDTESGDGAISYRLENVRTNQGTNVLLLDGGGREGL